MNLNFEAHVWPGNRQNTYNGTFQMGKAVKKKVTPSTRTYQTSSSELNTWSAVGLFRATQSERVHKQFGIILFTTANGRRLSDAMADIRRKLVIVGDGIGKVCPDNRNADYADNMFVSRRHVCFMYSRKEPSQRYVDIN